MILNINIKSDSPVGNLNKFAGDMANQIQNKTKTIEEIIQLINKKYKSQNDKNYIIESIKQRTGVNFNLSP